MGREFYDVRHVERGKIDAIECHGRKIPNLKLEISKENWVRFAKTDFFEQEATEETEY
jgi:hypothetical protein